MLSQLSLEGLEICSRLSSNIDVYCSLAEKRRFNHEKIDALNLFDGITTVLIYSGTQEFNPSLQSHNVLAERTELYGIKYRDKDMVIPDRALEKIFSDVFRAFYQAYSRENLPLNTIDYPDMKGRELQLEFNLDIVLELTDKFRKFLPSATIKAVNRY